MVTVQSRSGPIKNSVLPGHLTDLANFIGLGSRCILINVLICTLYIIVHSHVHVAVGNCVFLVIFGIQKLSVVFAIEFSYSIYTCTVCTSTLYVVFVCALYTKSQLRNAHFIIFNQKPFKLSA